MQFTVRDWMMDLIVFIDPESTVTEALAKMRRRFINSLIVNKTEDNPEYGIITSTDICDKIVARELNPSQTKVSDIMSSPLITVNENMNLKECAQKMKGSHIHHVPVVDDDENLVGMISATDFLVVAEAMGRAPGERIV